MATTVMVQAMTPTCPVCGTRYVLEVRLDGYTEWIAGMPIQQALPELTEDQRELLQTGITGPCWLALMGD